MPYTGYERLADPLTEKDIEESGLIVGHERKTSILKAVVSRHRICFGSAISMLTFVLVLYTTIILKPHLPLVRGIQQGVSPKSQPEIPAPTNIHHTPTTGATTQDDYPHWDVIGWQNFCDTNNYNSSGYGASGCSTFPPNVATFTFSPDVGDYNYTFNLYNDNCCSSLEAGNITVGPCYDVYALPTRSWQIVL